MSAITGRCISLYLVQLYICKETFSAPVCHPLNARLLLQLAYLQKYGAPPLAPADYLARNGLLPEDADEDSEQGAVQLFEAGRRSRAETALSPSSPPTTSLRTRSETLRGFGGPGSVSEASERSYATSLSQSEAGQSARRKKTLVRTAGGTACDVDSFVGCDEEKLIAMPLPTTIMCPDADIQRVLCKVCRWCTDPNL